MIPQPIIISDIYSPGAAKPAEPESIKRFPDVNYYDIPTYWFNGIKMRLDYIAKEIGLSRGIIEKEAKELNMSVQDYINYAKNINWSKFKKYLKEEKFEYKKIKKGPGPKEKVYEGMTCKEISEKYNIDLNIVRTRATRGDRTIARLSRPLRKRHKE